MKINFRTSILGAALFMGLASGTPGFAKETMVPKVKAIIFDYFTLFDVTPLNSECEKSFTDGGPDICRMWRAKVFEYTFTINVIGKRGLDFKTLAGNALDYAVEFHKQTLAPATRKKLLDSYIKLKPFGDVAESLKKLKASGVRLYAVTFLSPEMQKSNTDKAGITRQIEKFLTTEKKPDVRPALSAYEEFAKEIKLPKEQIAYVTSGNNDVFGAKSFGFITFMVTRFKAPAEKYGVEPDATLNGLGELLPAILVQKPN